jgi:hypothetical protein
MDELQRYLAGNFAGAYDRFNDHMRNTDMGSLEDLKRMTPVAFEIMLAQWAASLDTKTKHDLMKSSIDAIR